MVFGKFVNKYYLKYWYLFLLVIIFDAIVDLAQLLLPMMIGNIVSVFSALPGELSTTINLNPLRILTGFTNEFTIHATDTIAFYQTDLFLCLITGSLIGLTIFLGRMGWRFFSSQIGANIERDMRREMFQHIQSLSLSYYATKKVGGLLSFFTNDLSTIKQSFTDGLIFATDLIVLGSLSITLMSFMSWQVTLYTCVPLVVLIVFGGVVGAQEGKRYKISNDAFEDMSDYTEENLQGFSVIKAFRKEHEKSVNFRDYTEKAEKTSISYLRFSSMIDFGINAYLAITFTILFYLCCYAILLKGNAPFAGNIKEIGDLTKFVGYYDTLIWPMIAGGLLIDISSRASGARKRIAEILVYESDIQDEDNASTPTLKGDIEFRNLSFTFPDDSLPSLKNISFHVKPGMSVGIIGKTGCGKSTLVSLLPKLYNLPKGMLYIDGKDINDWKKSDLRNHIGYVLQEAFLFSGTIKDNIAFSENELNQYDMDRVIESAKFADVHDDIMAFKDGYDTKVSEKGTSLSGGQRQRVSIARAIYKMPSLLILDDSLSAVDADTEKNIISHFKTKDKITTFIIAHRVSAIEGSDLIVVMDQGKVISLGKHEDLLKTCPLYQEIVSLQDLQKEVLE
jgi:MDR-type ABC transporter (membrane associated ATPase)